MCTSVNSICNLYLTMRMRFMGGGFGRIIQIMSFHVLVLFFLLNLLPRLEAKVSEFINVCEGFWTFWLAKSEAPTVYKYIYISVCVCVCVWQRYLFLIQVMSQARHHCQERLSSADFRCACHPVQLYREK